LPTHIHAIRDEAAGIDKLPKLINCRQAMLRREFDNAPLISRRHAVCENNQRIGAF